MFDKKWLDKVALNLIQVATTADNVMDNTRTKM